MGFFGSFFKPNLAKCKEKRDVKGLARALAYEADPEIRFAAAVAIGELKDIRALEALVGALEDPSPKVRATAAAALGELRATQALGALTVCLLEEEEDQEVRRFLAANIEKIGGERAERALAEYKKHFCAQCANSLSRAAQGLRPGFDFVDPVRPAAQVPASPGRRCKCGATICTGCLPMGGSLSCPSCGSPL